MDAGGYRYQAEQAIEDPAALERLLAASERDPELDDADRAEVAAVVGRYLADDDRARHDAASGEPMDGSEDAGDGGGS